VDTYIQYVVPGGISVAVTPAGVTPAEKDFKGTGTFNGATGAFTGSVAAPTAAGSYTVTVRSCFGDVETLTCVSGTAPLTI
jgi:hypothetical protein